MFNLSMKKNEIHTSCRWSSYWSLIILMIWNHVGYKKQCCNIDKLNLPAWSRQQHPPPPLPRHTHTHKHTHTVWVWSNCIHSVHWCNCFLLVNCFLHFPNFTDIQQVSSGEVCLGNGCGSWFQILIFWTDPQLTSTTPYPPT